MAEHELTLTMTMPGTVVISLDLDDRGRWPGLRVTSWDRRGKGWAVTAEAPPLVWRAILGSMEDAMDNRRVQQNATRTALRRFAVTLRQELADHDEKAAREAQPPA